MDLEEKGEWKYLGIQAFYSAQHQVAWAGCSDRLVQKMAEPEHAVDCEDFIVSQEEMGGGNRLPLLSDGMELEGHAHFLGEPSQAPSCVLDSC